MDKRRFFYVFDPDDEKIKIRLVENKFENINIVKVGEQAAPDYFLKASPPVLGIIEEATDSRVWKMCEIYLALSSAPRSHYFDHELWAILEDFATHFWTQGRVEISHQ